MSHWTGDTGWVNDSGTTDPTAIHDDAAGEIAAVVLKAVPVAADLLLIEDSAAGDVKKRITIGSLPGGGGGLSSVDTGNTIWVDAVHGDNGTGTADRLDLPFLTVGAALAAAGSGDVVRVRSGAYPESGLTVPTGVVLAGDSWQTTTIGAAAATADILTMGAGSGIQGITVVVPTAAHAGIRHTTGTGAISGINIQGDGVAGIGDGIHKTGTGKLIGSGIRCETGGLGSYLRVDSGVLALDDVHSPQATGAIAAVLLAEGTGVFQGQGFNVGNSNAVDVVQVGGTATIRIYSPNIFAAANAVHITADGPDITLIGGKISAALRTVWIDPALTGTGTTVRALSTVLDPLFDFPAAAAGNADFVLMFNQSAATTRDSLQRLIGADLALGFPELGSALEVGRGAPYSDGIHVVTTDGTETMVGSVVTGGAQTDETTAAASRSASTFSFQGLTPDHAIYVASTRTTPAGTELKHWGYVLDQVAAQVGGATAVEIWDGSAWVAVGVMAASVGEQYVYADQTFLRAASEENVHLGISDTTTQALTTVNGVAAYHARIRVTSTLTTAPTWERLRVMESSRSINGRGQMSARGLAVWRKTLFGAGNMWGEGGGAGDYNVTVGSGVAADGETWSHKNKKGRINNSNDFTNFNFALPGGLNTAHPVKFRLLMSSTGAGDVDMRLSVLPVEVVGNMIADSGGAIAPVARPSAPTYDSAAAQVVDAPTFATITDTIQAVTFDGYDLSSYYADDLMILRVGFDPGGSARDVDIWALVIEGVSFASGKIL